MAESEKLQVTEQSQIEIRFTLSLLDGTVVDQTEGDEIFALQIGDGQMIHQLDQLLIGLEEGTKGTFHLQPDQAFGSRSEENLQTLAKTDFPSDLALEEGFVIGFDTPTGEQIPGTIDQILDETVVVDFNHPLAGHPVVFEVELLKIIQV